MDMPCQQLSEVHSQAWQCHVLLSWPVCGYLHIFPFRLLELCCTFLLICGNSFPEQPQDKWITRVLVILPLSTFHLYPPLQDVSCILFQLRGVLEIILLTFSTCRRETEAQRRVGFAQVTQQRQSWTWTLTLGPGLVLSYGPQKNPFSPTGVLILLLGPCCPACEMPPPIALMSACRFLKWTTIPTSLELRVLDPGEGAGREAGKEADRAPAPPFSRK